MYWLIRGLHAAGVGAFFAGLVAQGRLWDAAGFLLVVAGFVALTAGEVLHHRATLLRRHATEANLWSRRFEVLRRRRDADVSRN